MEWNLNIPKILHVYWGGGVMNYMRFMTIKTFMKHNPDWEIRFLYPKYPTTRTTWVTFENKDNVILCEDFLSQVMKLPITKIEIDFGLFGMSNEMSEVHKSDFIRLYYLSTSGGLWSDMDIIYIRPMNDFYLNTPENKSIETFVCNNEYGHSIGFMMGSKENKFFAKLSELSMREYSPLYYQILGATLYNKYFREMDTINQLTPAINFSMDVVYPHVAGNEEKIMNGTETNFTDRTLGIHWYAGHPQWKNFLIRTNGGLVNLPDTIIGNLLKNE